MGVLRRGGFVSSDNAKNGRPRGPDRSSVFMMAGLLLVVAAAVATGVAVDWSVDLDGIEGAIRSWGAWGVLASIALMVLHSLIPFPAELVAIANGMIYGPVWGTAITWTGAMLGALFAFGLARRLGRPFVRQLVARRAWQALDDWAAAEGGSLVLVARLIPVIAFNLINYAAGLSGMSWWTFAWTTGIGILPLTVLMVVMGDHIEVLPWWSWVVAAVAGAGLWYLLRRRLYPPPCRKSE
jgi:uncharacterized membrane protein YdjX (TVP38/TMEM64 family)